MGYRKITNLYANKEILAFKECFALEKIHGTSTSVSYNAEEDKLTFFHGGCNRDQFLSLFDHQKLLDLFRDNAKNHPHKSITVYGEGYGGKMQGMSKTYGTNLKFIAFEVLIDDWWMDVQQADKIATKLGFEFVHYVRINTTEERINEQMMADSVQAVRNGMGTGHMREGVILRPVFEYVHQDGGRVICKHKRPEFAERENTPRFSDPEKLKVLEDAQMIADEWITLGRLKNAQSHFDPNEWNMNYMDKIIKYIVNDVIVEAAEEIVVSKDVKRALGKKTAKLFQDCFREGLFEV